MAIGCFVGIPIDPIKLELSVASFAIAIIALFALRKFNLSTRAKISFIYAHLVFLFFPFVLFTANATCGIFCSLCYTNIFELIYLALPTTLVFTAISGFVILPTLFINSNKKREVNKGDLISFMKKYSRTSRIKLPKLYIVDNAKPTAFSFRSFKSAIFLSVGLLEILNKKEIQAIILHELAHIKQQSSLIKLSFSFLKTFSPLSLLTAFSSDSNREEKLADNFAVKMQKTNRYLISAKRKIVNFERML